MVVDKNYDLYLIIPNRLEWNQPSQQLRHCLGLSQNATTYSEMMKNDGVGVVKTSILLQLRNLTDFDKYPTLSISHKSEDFAVVMKTWSTMDLCSRLRTWAARTVDETFRSKQKEKRCCVWRLIGGSNTILSAKLEYLFAFVWVEPHRKRHFCGGLPRYAQSSVAQASPHVTRNRTILSTRFLQFEQCT